MDRVLILKDESYLEAMHTEGAKQSDDVSDAFTQATILRISQVCQTHGVTLDITCELGQGSRLELAQEAGKLCTHKVRTHKAATMDCA